MNFVCRSFTLVACFVLLLNAASCENEKNSSRDQLLQKLTSIAGKKYKYIYNKKTFYLEIHNKTGSNGNMTVYETEGSVTHVLGRNNDTDILGKDNWLLLMYGSGDIYNVTEDKCNGTRKSNIMIYCDRDVHEPVLKFVEHNKWKNTSCFYMFELITCSVCDGVVNEGLSRGSVFCIIFLTTVGVYLIIGISYRRLVKGAKGFEQIPHHKFWTRLGNLQADGCNLVCRREEEESWQRLTTNIKDMQDDQDDAMLRP